MEFMNNAPISIKRFQELVGILVERGRTPALKGMKSDPAAPLR
jgi:hypothetical protein